MKRAVVLVMVAAVFLTAGAGIAQATTVFYVGTTTTTYLGNETQATVSIWLDDLNLYEGSPLGPDYAAWYQGQVSLTAFGQEYLGGFNLFVSCDVSNYQICPPEQRAPRGGMSSVTFWYSDPSGEIYSYSAGSTDPNSNDLPASLIFNAQSPLASGDLRFEATQLTAVPEPGTILLLGTGLAATLARRRRH